MSSLIIDDLTVSVGGSAILKGFSLTVSSGEVHAIMGPNGTGKSTLSHVIMGRPGYDVTGGSVTLGGQDVLAMSTSERAQAGLFLAMQYPTEVPGVALEEMLMESARAGDRDPATVGARLRQEAERIGFDEEFLHRPLNVDLSGGEKKRNETVQLGVIQPEIAILDELDSGLDIDALRLVARRIEEATEQFGLGVLAITHYSRLFTELRPDVVHIMVDGRIVESGGPELADRLEADGYSAFGIDDSSTSEEKPERPHATGPFGNPFEEGFPDPFADPLA